jgi:hypothetical protein
MKVAKASQHDMDMAVKLCQFLDQAEDGYLPSLNVDDEAEWLNDDRDDLQKFHQRLLDIVKQGSLWRIIMGYHALLASNVFDPAESHLALRPELNANEALVKAARVAILALAYALEKDESVRSAYEGLDKALRDIPIDDRATGAQSEA